MSTYYYLVCDHCREFVPLITRTGHFALMSDAETDVPKFLEKHSMCDEGIDGIRFASEHDERSMDYEPYPCAEGDGE